MCLVVVDDKDWQKKSKIYSSISHFPSLEELASDPTFKDWRFDDAAWVLAGSRLQVLDFAAFFSERLEGAKFPYCQCQAHEKAGERCRMHAME